jgi:LysR family transcriptional regulator, glycine cleavage system transcriptional activator
VIAAPSLPERIPPQQPIDLANQMLLSSETRPGDWTDWMERAGLSQRADQRRGTFDHFFVTLQAVIDGLGVAVGPLPVLEIDVDQRLLTPFPAITVPRTGYVALIPFDANKTSALTRFIEWLVAEARGKP